MGFVSTCKKFRREWKMVLNGEGVTSEDKDHPGYGSS